ncbi:YlzJ-like family protein [Desulforamulus putei]|uniref:YlzJ-like protein n=1 Tax=Desulforamulus putei DSM 12395 TaxID=1121429 RepID=A0A1M4TE22_9FIRM|nr:YlzJ-like family protein [Desulforamulus putei]SHE42693.1 YlzJ-like protein [Desulforamulus putei DSM 12395]
MILWTPLPAAQVLAGLDDQVYPDYESGEVSGIPVLLEKAENGKKRVVRINSSDPAHYLNKDVYPGLIT